MVGRPHPLQHLGGNISEPRINERIHANEVRLVGPAGEQVGIVRLDDALRLAREADRVQEFATALEVRECVVIGKDTPQAATDGGDTSTEPEPR